MGFGKNIQFLRMLHGRMTQEELAEKMNVSRQTISKWELEITFPEMEKAILLCKLFSCSLDELLLKDMDYCDEAYINIRVEEVCPFQYVKYAVISREPEEDAIRHIEEWAESFGIKKPEIIGWDFPCLSQEQINVFHMHGYVAACILPEGFDKADLEVHVQEKQLYAVITIKDPFKDPFVLIPNAYKTLGYYIEVNRMKGTREQGILQCFEKTYEKDGITYMDVSIAIER
ncbi:MAG: helix-turn-helix domain-containing protein [Lachnospiraceae bacterium]|nr:helix-turn-helix domain-containing protein [Lachnospiraceae bacterium]